MYTLNDIMKYRCPRWNELPDIELYMDQVVGVIDKNLDVFRENDEYKVITKTMISNYVKHKIMKPPNRKKYDRTHLAYLFIVCILKRFMSLTEIRDGMNILLSAYSVDEAYDLFCSELEASIKRTFTHQADDNLAEGERKEIINVVKSVTLAFANIFYARYLISLKSGEIKPHKTKKADGREL